MFPIQYTSDSVKTTNIEISSIDSLNKELKQIHTEIKEYNAQKPKDTISPDTVYTVQTTLFVFLAGIIIDRFLKWLDRVFKRKNLRRTFKSHITKIGSQYLRRLEEVYLKFGEEYTIESGIPKTPPQVFSSDFVRILDINKEEIFSAYRNNEFSIQAVGCVIFANKVMNEMDQFHSFVYKENIRIRMEIEALLDKYMTSLDTFTYFETVNNPEYKNSETYIMAKDAIEKYYTKLGSTSIKYFYNKILRKIQKRIAESNEYRTHEKIHTIAEDGKRLTYAINSLDKLHTDLTSNYKNFAGHIMTTRETLENAIKKL